MATSAAPNPRLLADFADEPRRMLLPITEYAEEPLVPLTEACEPLKDILNAELAQYITVALMNSKAEENGLTNEESAAIHLYTIEWRVAEQSLYAVLNQTLRQANRRALVPWHKYLKLLMTAFFKLP